MAVLRTPVRAMKTGRCLFEDSGDVVPLSPTSSELDSPRSTGVRQLEDYHGVVPPVSFYGNRSSPIKDATDLLAKVRATLPKVRTRLSFNQTPEEAKEKRKRPRSAGGGDSIKKKKLRRLEYIPFEEKKVPKKKEVSINKTPSHHQKRRYNFEIFSTPTSSRNMHNRSSVALTPPSTGGKKRKIKDKNSPVKENVAEDPTAKDTLNEKPWMQGMKDIIMEMITDDDDKDKVEVESLIKDLSDTPVKSATPRRKLLDEAENLLKDLTDEETSKSTSKRLFPIFNSPKIVKDITNTPTGRKKRMGFGADQLQLDVGQKNLREVECSECQMVYCQGLPEDEENHRIFHNRSFKIGSWKNELIVGQHFGDKILKVTEKKPKQWSRCNEILNEVDHILGFPQGIKPHQIYVYVSGKNIVGLLAAVHITEAYRLLSKFDETVICSDKAENVIAGVSRIWTHPTHRKKGIATALLDAMRNNFVFGMILSDDKMALSSPTPDGVKFGSIYFKRNDFLIYL